MCTICVARALHAVFVSRRYPGTLLLSLILFTSNDMGANKARVQASELQFNADSLAPRLIVSAATLIAEIRVRIPFRT
jgi:hypothetical protein